jgi:hypothetical protein
MVGWGFIDATGADVRAKSEAKLLSMSVAYWKGKDGRAMRRARAKDARAVAAGTADEMVVDEPVAGAAGDDDDDDDDDGT